MATSKKTSQPQKVEKVIETKTCITCGCEKHVGKFYKKYNKYICDKFGVCKECIEKIGKSEDMTEVHRILRTLDIVFLPDRWEKCSSYENTLVTYIGNGRGINNPNAKIDGVNIVDMRYEDSPTYSPITDVDKYLISSDSERLENVAKWGEHYSQAEYLTLNKSVENNIKVTGRDDYQSIKNFERVARAEVERDRAYANSNLKPSDKKSAEDNVTNMMKQAGLSYEQTNRNTTDSTLGTDIRDIIEAYNPLPIATDEFKDVDNIGKYIFRFLTKPMMRAMGKDMSKTKDDYEEIRREIKAKEKMYEQGGGN